MQTVLYRVYSVGMIEWEESNPVNGGRVFYTQETDSTMTLARSGIPAGQAPAAVVAGYQRSGRGRSLGRTWVSPPDESLLVSFTLERKQFALPPQVLPLVTGLGVARFLERDMGLVPAIKWPNDVLVTERKICGILCESAAGHYLVGIGLNIWERAFDASLQRRLFPPVSLLQACGLTRPDRDQLAAENRTMLKGLLAHLAFAYRDPGWHGQIQQRLYGLGRPVCFRAGAADAGENEAVIVSGTLQGITVDGGALIDDSAWYAGEIESFG